MDNIFARSKLNPILSPNPANWWEAKKLYNPGAIFHNGKFYLFYRAVGKGENWKSSIGLAVSEDGENFQRFDEPLMVGESELEKRGLEDPRITFIDNTFYMTYAAYDGITPRLSIATSQDLKKWQKRGFAFPNWNFEKAGGVYTYFEKNKPVIRPEPNEWSKSGGIFPEKINGRFLMLFGEHGIWFAESNDGLKWQGDQKPFLEPRNGNYFDNTFVEMGPPPIKTEKGWLVLYHGVDEHFIYRIGFLLLDLKNPREILFRSQKPIFQPKENYELKEGADIAPEAQVVFCCGTILSDNLLRIYYGASDSVICTATANIEDILNIAR